MFTNQPTPGGESLFVEATVKTVDLRRSVCKCQTNRKKDLHDVRWGYELGQHSERGSNSHPVPEERVLLVNVMGGYYILMSLGSPQLQDSTIRSSIGQGRGTSRFHEEFNYSQGEDSFRREGATPRDMFAGDKVFTGERGSLFGMLKSGTFIAKASGLAQLLISRMDDLLRIVSRNYEMFSDAMTHYSVNLSGRVYTYQSHFKNQSSSRADSPDYYEVFGDVAAGDVAKEKYLEDGLTLNPVDDVVKLQRIPSKDGQGEANGTRWLSTYTTAGKRLEVASSFDSAIRCTITSEEGHWRVEVENSSGVASIDVTPTEIKSLVGSCEVKQTPTGVEVNAPESVVINTMTATLNATTSATIVSPSVVATTPSFSIAAASGTATVNVSGCNVTADTCTITGTNSDIVLDGISLKGHTHTGNLGNPTSTPNPS